MAHGLAAACGLMPLLSVLLASAAAVTPVEQVLSMLNEMKSKGVSMMAEEKAVFSEYSKWADGQTTELSQEITTLQSTIKKTIAYITKADTDVKHLAKEITEIDGDIDVLEKDKKAATEVRAGEHEEYLKTAQDYSESVDALERAIQTMSSQGYDRAQATAMLQKMASSTPGMPRVLASFLQATKKAGDDGAPEVAAYEFQSTGIVEVLEGLLEKFKKELSDVENAESNGAHAFDLEEMHLTDLITRNSADRAEKASTKGKIAAALGKAKGELNDAKTDLAENEKVLMDMKATFGVKSGTFEENQKVRALELEALDKAIEIISSPDVSGGYAEHVKLVQLDAKKPAAFLQLRSRHKRVNVRQRASEYLHKRASALSSTTLRSLADQVASNPFGKVIDMITELIAKLKEEAASEADHKAWCDKELKDNKLKREKKTRSSDKLATQVTELGADIVDMGKEIATLAKEQADLTTAMAEATEMRTKEKAKNADTIKDANAGAEAVKRALVILKEFYSSQGAFLQQTTRQVPEMAAYKGMSGAKGGVVGMMEVILSDFTRLAADTSASETAAAQEYEGFMSDGKADKKEKHEREVHLRLTKDQSEFELSQLKKSKEGVDEELAKANAYYEDLKPSCLTVHVDYEERAAKRQEEIEALKEAYKILDAK